MEEFESGYNYFTKLFGTTASSVAIEEDAIEHADYIKEVNFQIDKLAEKINSFKGSKKGTEQLKGDVAEFWAAGTYDVNAAKAQSINRAEAIRSTGLGSPDVVTTWGDNYSLKYNNKVEDSIKEQSKTVYERYKEYASKSGNPKTYEEYLDSKGMQMDPDHLLLLYCGQKRIVPSDLYEKIKELLIEKIRTEEARRPEQAQRYRETLEMLRTKVQDNKGVSGFSLSNEEARKLAELGRMGLYDPRQAGIELKLSKVVGLILQDAFKAGLTSAVITTVLRTTPELYKVFVYLIKTGEIDVDQLKKTGVTAISSAGEGFLRGFVTGAIISACKASANAFLQNLDPTIIAAIATITLESVRDSIKVSAGSMNVHEMTNNLIRNVYVTSCSVALGAVAQYFIEVPILGYLLGSTVGSIIGGFTYEVGYNLTLAFCVESGFTMFGLVEQNYELPKDVLEEIGVDVFEYEEFIYDEFKPDEFILDEFEIERFSLEDEDDVFFKPMRRGVIGVGRVGYIW